MRLGGGSDSAENLAGYSLSSSSRCSTFPKQFITLCGEGEWFVGTRGGSAVFVNVLESRREGEAAFVQGVSTARSGDTVTVTVQTAEGEKTFSFSL